MLSIKDLSKATEVFNLIAQKSVDKTKLVVSFKPLNETTYTVVMSNGNESARLIVEREPKIMQCFNISYNDFLRLFKIFNDRFNVSVDNSKIYFKKNKNSYGCVEMKSQLNDSVKFKFDFDGSYKITIDKPLILKTTSFGGVYAIADNEIASTDGYLGVITRLDANTKGNVFLFRDEFPNGTYFYNPNSNLIVSEDKKLCYTMRQAVNKFPYKTFSQLAQSNLNNYFICDYKEFYEHIRQCVDINKEHVIIYLNDDTIGISSVDKNGTCHYEVEIQAQYKTQPKRKMIRFNPNYMLTLTKANEDDKIKIEFDDDERIRIIRAKSAKHVIFGAEQV